ncbi:MAG: Hpt domain-containing protein [Rhizobiaceae bacterium]
MTLTNPEAVAFAMPGGETCAPSRSRPVDLVHLARQTMGDRTLEEEVLQLFMQQAMIIGDRILNANPSERRRLAHGLKGSARGIGAFAVAECAFAIEENPEQASLVTELGERLRAVREFIASISR